MKLRVLADASPLRDARASAGIGRYVSQLLRALREVEDLDLRLANPPLKPARESWVVRWFNAQPSNTFTAVRWRPAVMHAMASEPAMGWPLRRQVVTLHDLVPWTTAHVDGVTARYLDWQWKRMKRVAAVIAVSSSVAGEAARLGLDDSRIHIVPEGVDPVFTSESTPEDSRLRLAAGTGRTPYVMWVGSMRRHDPRKASDVLIRAMRPLGTGYSLVMAGALGEESTRLAGLARELGVDLVLPGHVSDATLAALYRGAAAVAMPSLYEGFGLPVLEALACGAAVVASGAGAIEEVAGDAALLVRAGITDEVTEALRWVLSDPDMRARLGSAGVERARNFTWEKAAEQTAEVYREVARVRS